MWRLGFFFHEMAFGLLSIFIPLYVVRTLGGSLVELGIMASMALLLGIPASFFWGYICDKTRRYKAYILLSFVSASVIIYAFTLTGKSIVLFIVLYVVMQMLHVAHEAPKNVLIAEHYSRQDWEKSFASYQRLTEVGWLLGLLLGLVASTLSLSAHYTLFLCSGLNLAAFVLSIFLVSDPLLIFERRLVSIERKIDYTDRGVRAASQILDGYSSTDKLKQESFLAFGIALVFFSLALNTFLTPLPIFFAQKLAFPPSLIFVIYMLNSGGRYRRLPLRWRKIGVYRCENAGTPNCPSSKRIDLSAGCSRPDRFCHNAFRCSYFGAVKFCLRSLLYSHDFTLDGTHTHRQGWRFRRSRRLGRGVRLLPGAFSRSNAGLPSSVPNCWCNLLFGVCNSENFYLAESVREKRRSFRSSFFYADSEKVTIFAHSRRSQLNKQRFFANLSRHFLQI